MKNSIITIIIAILFGNAYSQIYEDTICWVWVTDAQYTAKQGLDFSDNANLNIFFTEKNVVYYEKALPFAHNPELHKIHEIRCTSEGNIDEIINELSNSYSQSFKDFSKFEVIDTSLLVYDPIDYMWVNHIDWLWHLTKIQADLAWDITIGDPSVNIAVIDTDFDVTHPDLASEIFPHYDPYTLEEYDCIESGSLWYAHGTGVASFASGETTEPGTTSQGQLASVGFNTKMIAYKTGYRQDVLTKALHASNVMNASVIVSCAGGSLNCSPDSNSGEELIVKEILDNGTVIVMPAGNGLGGYHCGNVNNYTAFYPFHPEYDERIIVVTSTDADDYHYWLHPDGEENTHSHFPEVDICAPGYNIMSAEVTDCGDNEWPYYGSAGGTSFAAPIVAGAVGLLKSIDPDLTPAQIQYIIKSTADPVADADDYPGLIGAGRLNIFNAAQMAVDFCDIIVSGNEVWQEDREILCNLIIEDGAELNIEATVNFSQQSKVIVKRGGTLIVNGGTLTTSGDNFWKGIEVWGDPEATQIPPNQGWLSITNGGTIQNAEVAVRMGNTNAAPPYGGGVPVTYFKGGGILQTSNAVFRNNRSGVIFHQYRGYNTSNLNLTTFETTDELADGTLPLNHITMSGVEGIQIKGCTFANSREGSVATTDRGNGIKSFNATFYVDHQCISGTTPCTEYQQTAFQGLQYGIYAIASNTNSFPDVRNTVFENNYRGAYLNGITLARVTSNSFYLNTAAADEGYGLYLDGCDQYWVEENTFTKCNGCTGPTGIGMIVNNSGGNPNEVYRNVFDEVEYAINVQGENRDWQNPAQGLVLRCNQYFSTEKDETIIWNGPLITRRAGIADEQGTNSLDIEDMAGNIFYYDAIPENYDDLDNEANFFDYYYSTNAGDEKVEPQDAQFGVTVAKQGMQTPEQWSLEDGCEPNIGSGGGGTEEERGRMAAAQQNIETTEAILNALIDGGDTETLTTEVETSSPPEAVEVYNELMEKSPNLSETVVENTIERESVLPNPMVRDVMVANPHTAKSISLLEQLDDRFDPMPDYMKAQILAGRSIQNLKQDIEAQLAKYQLKKAKAMNHLIRYYHEMPDGEAATDSIIALCQADNTLQSAYHLAWLWLQKGEYQQGNNMMNSIPVLFNLNEHEQQVHDQMAGIFGMISGLYANGSSIDSLSAAQISGLQTLADEGNRLPHAYARNILLTLGEISYEEPILFPDNMKLSAVVVDYQKLINTPAPGMLEIYPNPSKNYVILQYNLLVASSETTQEGEIVIQDMTGITKSVITLTEKRDQLTLITQGWPPGVYIAMLKLDGKTQESIKFTLTK